jgi:uncharacterized protein
VAAVLLDVNVLVALFWAEHADHGAAQQWFREHARRGWATCPFTQAAFIRLVSNPAFSRDAVSPTEAVALLEENLRHPSHEFWADDLRFADIMANLEPDLTGHRQITDAYLLGLAIHHKSRLVTFDKSLSALLPAGRPKAEKLIELSKRVH